MESNWHSLELYEVFSKLDSSENGLTEKEAKKRLENFGLNELKEAKKISPLEIFIGQFKSVVVWILIIATIISAFLGEYIDAIVILVIIILIAVLGFIQEYRAEKSIEALRKLASLKAIVLRDNQKREIDAKEIVPGDVIFLETGDKVPADARLLEATNLQTQEAILTGESNPVNKVVTLLPEKTPLTERKNFVFSSTIVVSGRAKAIVVSTGMQTEIGKIARMLTEVEQELTPLQKKMDELGIVLSKAVVITAVIIFTAGLLFHRASALDMLLVAVALAVAAIPESLLAIVTIALAIGTRRMLKRNSLIRKLPSVETLGSTTVICTDKTGTLTVNEMTVRKIFVNNRIIEITGVGYEKKGNFLYNGKEIGVDDETKLLLKIGALNNNAELINDKLIGDPTEGALLISAEKAGLVKKELEREYPRIGEIEFTSERKLMTTIHLHKNKKVVYSKGAPEILLEKCTKIQIKGKIRALTAKDKKEILEVNKKFANEALRVLAFAYNVLDENLNNFDADYIESSLIFIGLQGMIDPPREEVKEAIEKCKKAGIRVVMITGDNEITAKAVAREINLHGGSMTGKQLDEIENLDKVIDEITIFARVNPEHKIKIIDALKKKGHVVAMTGDGVNDAPALKKADIGIAMGITGTDVAKEASDMILLDDNFASIVNAIEEGRGVYDNIRKYIGFLLSGNISEVLIIFFGMIIFAYLPLTATQILLINLVTDGLPALALSNDPFEPNAMLRKPRKKDDKIYSGLKAFLVYYPIVMTITALLIFNFFLSKGTYQQAQTATFLTIGMFELYQAFASRSTIYPALKVGIFKNRFLVLAVLSSFSIISAAIFIPEFGRFLDMTPMSIEEFLFICIISSIGAITIEIYKHLSTKREK
ncbi:MAG: calcium-translocating P-type ATPase, PMCA-type [Candidatus Altiarchaeota archaeon]